MGGEGRRIGHRVAAGRRPELLAEAEGRQGGEATGASALNGDALGTGLAGRHQGLGSSRAVGHVHHPPLAIQPLAVGAAEAGGAAVVHVHHPPAAGGPELDAQAQAAAGHARGPAVALHQQGGLGMGATGRRIEPGVGGLVAVAGEPQGLGHADGLWGQRTGRHRFVPPAAVRQIQAEQALGCAGVAGHRHQAAVFGAEAGQVIEGKIQRLPGTGGFGRIRGLQQHPSQLPGAVTAGRRQQLLAVPGAGAHPIHPLGHGELGPHRQQRAPAAAAGVEQLQVPETGGIAGRHQLVGADPERLEHRDPLACARPGARHHLRGVEQAVGPDRRQPEAAALPGHAGLLPLHPGQLRPVRAEHGIAAEVGGLVQQLGFAARQGHGHQVVAAPLLHHADPALPVGVDQAIGEGPLAGRFGETPGVARGGAGVGIKAQVPQAAVAVVHPHQIAAGDGGRPAPVFVHPAAQVPLARGELDGGLGLIGRCHQQGGATALMGALLQPEQPATLQQRFLDAGRAAHHRFGR